jgi:DNA-binding transcriptional regulator GbsR (MarR family)
MTLVETVQESFVQLWGGLGPFWGVSPTTARVYGWLLSHTAGADAQEIMKGLDLSRGAVSMACRELREWGLVYPEKSAGSRRMVYWPQTDMEKVTRSVVQIRKRREWDPIREHLREWIPQLEGDPSPEAAILLERLKAIETLAVLADSMVEMFLRGGSLAKMGMKILARGGMFQSQTKGDAAPLLEMAESLRPFDNDESRTDADTSE